MTQGCLDLLGNLILVHKLILHLHSHSFPAQHPAKLTPSQITAAKYGRVPLGPSLDTPIIQFNNLCSSYDRIENRQVKLPSYQIYFLLYS